MFCPTCKAEYRAGRETCADCRVPLVETLPEGDSDRAQELVTVLRTTDPALLPVAVSVLEAAGIPYIVQGEAGVSVLPLGPAAAHATHRATGAMLLVNAGDYDEALALLEGAPEDGG